MKTNQPSPAGTVAEKCCHYPGVGHCWHCEKVKAEGGIPQIQKSCPDWVDFSQPSPAPQTDSWEDMREKIEEIFRQSEGLKLTKDTWNQDVQLGKAKIGDITKDAEKLIDQLLQLFKQEIAGAVAEAKIELVSKIKDWIKKNKFKTYDETATFDDLEVVSPKNLIDFLKSQLSPQEDIAIAEGDKK